MGNQLVPIGPALFNYIREQAKATIAFNHFLCLTNQDLKKDYDVSNCKTCLRQYLGVLEAKILEYGENHPETKITANYFLSRLNEINVLNKKKQLTELEKIFSLNSE